MLRWKFQYSMQPAIFCPCEFQAAAYSTSAKALLECGWLLKLAILMPRLPSRPSHLRLALPLRIPQSAPAVLVSNSCMTLYVSLNCSSSVHNSIDYSILKCHLHRDVDIEMDILISIVRWVSCLDPCRIHQYLGFGLYAHASCHNILNSNRQFT